MAASTTTARAHFRAVGRKDSLVACVAGEIERQILDGSIPVGTVLPAERELAGRLAVSRPVLREAVRTLVTRGLLETRHGVGTRVRALTRQYVVEPLTWYLKSGSRPVQLAHLHHVRTLLEVDNAGAAAENATPGDLVVLEELCRRMDASGADPEEFARADADFHRAIATITQNPLLVFLLDTLRDLMVQVRSRVASLPHLPERVMPTHHEILDCIRGRDREGARAAMARHLDIALEIQRELTAGMYRKGHSASGPGKSSS